MKYYVYIVVLLVLMLVGCQSVQNNPQINLAEAARDNSALGLAYLAQNQPKLAYEKLELACHQAPQDASVWLSLAYFYQKNQHAQQAGAAYQKALDLSPKQGEILNNYAAFLCQQGKYQQARDFFKKALADPTYLYRDKVYVNQSICDKMATSG